METALEKKKFESNSSVSKKMFDITDITGGDGLWQKRIFLLFFLLQAVAAFHMFSMVFLAPDIDHWCARSPEERNLTVKQWKVLAIPMEDQHCSRYADINFTLPFLNRTNSDGNNTVPCDTWEYDNTVYSSTVLSQFDLVCDRKWMISLSKSLLFAGVITNSILFSHASDWIGRKPVIIISGFITLFSSFVSAYSTSFTMFLVLRIFIGLSSEVNIGTPFVFLMEIVGPKHRNVYGMAIGMGFSLGMIFLSLTAWLLRDSFWIQIAITAFGLIFIAAWWIPESPRWLLSHGKVEEAENVLINAAKTNGVEISVEILKTSLRKKMSEKTESCKPDGKKVTAFDLFKTPELRKLTLNLSYNWVVNSFVYHGLSQNTNELAGNSFVNFALYGIMEIPAILIGIFIVQKLGKRNIIGASMIIVGVTFCVCDLLPSDPWWLTVTVTMIGKFFITISFGIIFIYSSELYPTVARNIGMGVSTMGGRISLLVAPFMRELGNATSAVFPQIIYSVFSISSGLLIFLLPDTRLISMPDTIEEAEQFLNSWTIMIVRHRIEETIASIIPHLLTEVCEELDFRLDA